MTETNTQPRRAPVACGSARDSQPRADYHFTLATRTGGDPGPAHGLVEAASALAGVNSLRQGEFDLPITESAGRLASASELWECAIHEAGHAVVAVYYNLPISDVVVRPDVTGRLTLDRAKIEPILDGPDCVRYLSKQVVMGYSGLFAQFRANPDAAAGIEDWEYNKDWLYWMWDAVLYQRRFERRTPGEWPLTKAQVEEIIQRRARRLKRISRRLVRPLFPIIQLVAIALRERKRLTGDEVVAIAEPRVAKLRAALAARSAPRPAIARPVMPQITPPAEPHEWPTARGTS